LERVPTSCPTASGRGTIGGPCTTSPEGRAPVKIQEADAKSLLVAQGLPVPRWTVARTPAEAREAAEGYLAGMADEVMREELAADIHSHWRKRNKVKIEGLADLPWEQRVLAIVYQRGVITALKKQGFMTNVR